MHERRGRAGGMDAPGRSRAYEHGAVMLPFAVFERPQ
jgi:hypothetical protein